MGQHNHPSKGVARNIWVALQSIINLEFKSHRGGFSLLSLGFEQVIVSQNEQLKLVLHRQTFPESSFEASQFLLPTGTHKYISSVLRVAPVLPRSVRPASVP